MRFSKEVGLSGSRLGGTWPVSTLLVFAVTLPALCVIWLMLRASQSDEIAFRQALKQSRVRELALAGRQLSLHASSWHESIRSWGESFGGWNHQSDLLERGLGEALAVPEPPMPPLSREEVSDLERRMDELRYVWQTFGNEAAVEWVRDGYSRGELHSLRTSSGRALEPSLLLEAILWSKHAGLPTAELESVLFEWLARDRGFIPAVQRRHLLRRMLDLEGTEGRWAKLYDAELLLQQWIQTLPSPMDEADRGFLSAGTITSVALGEGAGHVLLRSSFLKEQLLSQLSNQSIPEAAVIQMLAPDEISPGGAESSESVNLEFPLMGWRLALAFPEGDPMATGQRPILIYAWVGGWVLVISWMLVFLVLSMVRRQTSRVAFRNDLVATVSHELKTPIASTRLLVDTLLEKEDGLDMTQCREYLRLIQNENQRLAALVERFLTFSRMERGRMVFEFQWIEPHALVEEAANAFRERFSSADYTFEVSCAEDVPKVFADRQSLLTGIGNLLENAFKYSENPKVIHLRAQYSGKFAVFEVQDNGPGIAHEESSRIFRKFYQPDRRLTAHKGGVGLGLSIVSFVARRHKGRVELHSDPGQGSLFRILIPYANHTYR
jgi:signal transduction histidine kinase